MYTLLQNGLLTIALSDTLLVRPKNIVRVRLEVGASVLASRLQHIQIEPNTEIYIGKPNMQGKTLTIPVNTFEAWRLCKNEPVYYGKSIESRMDQCNGLCRQITLEMSAIQAPTGSSTLQLVNQPTGGDK